MLQWNVKVFGSFELRPRGRRDHIRMVVVQYLPITTTIVSSNPVHSEVYSIQNYVIKVCQRLAAGRSFSPCTVSFTNNNNRHDIIDILLKVALNTINHSQTKPICTGSCQDQKDGIAWLCRHETM